MQFLSHTEDIQQTSITKRMIRDLAPHTPIHEEAWDTIGLRDYIKRLYHCHDDHCLHDEHLFMSHTFKDLRTLSLAQWKTILEGMPGYGASCQRDCTNHGRPSRTPIRHSLLFAFT